MHSNVIFFFICYIEYIYLNTYINIMDKNENIVRIGSFVSLKSKNRIINFILVLNDGDPIQGKISVSSPVGSSLIGKKINDIIKIKTQATEINYKIITIKNNI